MKRVCGHASAVSLLLFATPLLAQRSEHRVIDRAAIAVAGWHRLGDIVAALPPGSAASIDGFNHELRGSRLGFFQTTQVTATWLVRLDGQIIPVQIGGTWILDEIPVAITQLDSVVIVEGPRLTDGRAAVVGTIDLYSRRARGASILGDYQHGDETGDPGPYRYTSRATPNIEKLGPFTSGAAAIGSAAASLDLAARYSSLNITDQRIVNHVGATFGGYQSDVNASGGSGVATFDALGGRTYVIAGRGRFTGFLPLATVDGNEQARVIASHAGISGSLNALHRAWRFAASGTELELAPLGATPLLVADSVRRFTDALLEGEIVSGWHAGAGVTTGRQESATEVRQRPSSRAWLSHAGPIGGFDVALEQSSGRFRFSGATRFDRAVSDSDRLGISLTRVEAWRLGDFAWMDQSVDDSSGTTASEVRFDLTTRVIMRARPTWYLRAFSYAGIGTSPVQGLAGGVSAATIENTRFSARVRAEITQLLGDAGTGESSTPAGFVDGALSTRTAGGFHLAVSGRYAPRTHWSGSVEDLPATRRIDFSVNKSMWRDRVRAQLVMRNLLNAAERSHPEGAQWNFRTHLAITVALPSGASR
jgi:hypothetical protein